VGCDSQTNPSASAEPSGSAAKPVTSRPGPGANKGPTSQPEPIPPPADVATPPADAQKTESGLAYKNLAKGTGTEHPTANDAVSVHYTGWTSDGKMFDSSVLRKKPAQFPLRGVIKGWTEGVQLMVVGDKTRFWIPSELAYNNAPGKPAGQFTFDIELLEIKKAPERPNAPRRPRAPLRRLPPRRSPHPRTSPSRRRTRRRRRAVSRTRSSRPARARLTRRLTAASRCTTRAGRPTGRCSTARS